MRRYAVVVPTFWTGTTGRAIRAAGRDAQVVALYLITAPSANMAGLYYLPLVTLCHEVGITRVRAKKALDALAQVGFAEYDEQAECVWVLQMVKYQVGDSLKAGDKRIPAINGILDVMKGHGFVLRFLEAYGTAFHLSPNGATPPPDEASQVAGSPSEGASKGHHTGPGTETETGAGAGKDPERNPRFQPQRIEHTTTTAPPGETSIPTANEAREIIKAALGRIGKPMPPYPQPHYPQPQKWTRGATRER